MNTRQLLVDIINPWEDTEAEFAIVDIGEEDLQAIRNAVGLLEDHFERFGGFGSMRLQRTALTVMKYVPEEMEGFRNEEGDTITLLPEGRDWSELVEESNSVATELDGFEVCSGGSVRVCSYLKHSEMPLSSPSFGSILQDL